MTIRRPIMIVGDVHGHLQLALSLAHLWQEERGIKFEAILLCGDVGSFTREEELDEATKVHAKKNPIELEFLYQWMSSPQPPWIDAIFRPVDEGGLGIEAPVVMIHGNHEGFQHLSEILPEGLPDRAVELKELPTVDSGGRIRYLPSGWAFRTSSGTVVGGVGGIDPQSRKVSYHPMARIEKAQVENIIRIASRERLDILLTHQGPKALQKKTGTELLDPLIEMRVARFWFHGHGMDTDEIHTFGSTTLVPLATLSFGKGEVFPDARSIAILLPPEEIIRGLPERYRELHRNKWLQVNWNGRVVMVSPLLSAYAYI